MGLGAGAINASHVEHVQCSMSGVILAAISLKQEVERTQEE